MDCIGDECARPHDASVREKPRTPLIRLFAFGVICAALGFFAAQTHPASEGTRHLIAIAPPLVLVSEIGE